MFFRTKSINGTPLVQLVESFRNSEGLPRQRVIASIGDASLPESEKKAIAFAVESRLAGNEDFFPPRLSPDAALWVDRILTLASRHRKQKPSPSSSSASEEKIDGVLIDSVQNENIVQLGPELVALHAWNQLDLTPALTDLGMNPSQIATAQLLVGNRLIEPLSEWALIDWSRRSALPEILDIRPTKSAKDRLYQAGDVLFSKRKKIEEHLREREKNLFSLPRSIVLYDMTNTHFEGLCHGNPKAHHGRNKQGRNDCRHDAIGMAFDENGFALAHEIFEGNIGESKTLLTILQRLSEGANDSSGEKKKSLVVLDAGFATKENIALLQAEGHGYIVNATRSRREQYADAFLSEGFVQAPGRKEDRPVEVKAIDDPEQPGAKLVLCRSQARAEKELAMLSKAEERFLKEANKLRERVEKGLLKAADRIERAVGKLFKTHPRVARFYSVEREGQGLSIQRKDETMERAQESCGNYVLKTDQTMEGTQIWELYMSLLQAEEGFQLLKGTLGLRPNDHALEERVEAHIFMTVLAYHLLTWIRKKLSDGGERRDWRGLRRILSTHSVVTTVMPLGDGSVLRIRKASKPDQEQEGIYRALGIDWKAGYLTQKTVH